MKADLRTSKSQTTCDRCGKGAFCPPLAWREFQPQNDIRQLPETNMKPFTYRSRLWVAIHQGRYDKAKKSDKDTLCGCANSGASTYRKIKAAHSAAFFSVHVSESCPDR